MKGKITKILNLIEGFVIPDKLVEFEIDKGQKFFTIPSFSAQGLSLFLSGQYGTGTELIFQKIFASLIQKGHFVVDVGAHFGFYTLIAAERVGDSGLVLAFEPSSFNYKIFKLNIEANNYSNVKIYNVGLGETDTTARLAIPKGAKSGENTMAIEGDVKFIENITIKRFDSVFYKEKFRKIPDMVKIDVEGAELLVLRGFGDLLHDIKYLLIEIHPEKMKILDTTSKELFEILGASQFKIYLIHENNLQELRKDEYFRVRNRCHILAINKCVDEGYITSYLRRILTNKKYTLGAKSIKQYYAKRIIARLLFMCYYLLKKLR